MKSRDTSSMCAELHRMLEKTELYGLDCRLENIPKSGVYFLYQNGMLSGHDGLPRIVYVGIKKSESADRWLSDRILDHYTGWSSSLTEKIGADFAGQEKWWRVGTIEEILDIHRKVISLFRREIRFRVIKVEHKENRERVEKVCVPILHQCKKCEARGANLWNKHYKNLPVSQENLDRVKKIIENGLNLSN